MIMARFETRNFEFIAYGETDEDALSALEAGLQRHAKQYDIISDWYECDRDSFETFEIELGCCYRDNERIL